jgi:hypothetical protein
MTGFADSKFIIGNNEVKSLWDVLFYNNNNLVTHLI